MFTPKRLIVPKYSADVSKDVLALTKAIQDHFLALEKPGALSVVDVSTWTPTLTFATPGDLSVTYTDRLGYWWRVCDTVTLQFRIVTASFTHTTATGALQITGSPFTAGSTVGNNNMGNVLWGGITKANYTQVVPRVAPSASAIDFFASGSGQTIAQILVADVPTGGTVALDGFVSFQVQ